MKKQLQEACLAGDLKAVQYLLTQKDVQLEAEQNLAFTLACQGNNPQVVQFLAGLIDIEHNNNYEALRVACTFGHQRVAEIIVFSTSITPHTIRAVLEGKRYRLHPEVLELARIKEERENIQSCIPTTPSTKAKKL